MITYRVNYNKEGKFCCRYSEFHVYYIINCNLDVDKLPMVLDRYFVFMWVHHSITWFDNYIYIGLMFHALLFEHALNNIRGRGNVRDEIFAAIWSNLKISILKQGILDQ